MNSEENNNKIVDEKKLIRFLKESKFSIIIIILFLLFAFGERIISRSFSIDTELYIYHFLQNSSNVNWDWWNSLSRWGLVLINKIFDMYSFPIYAKNFVSVLIMFIYSIAFNYLFYINLKDKYKKNFVKLQFIFPIIFLTNPIFAEQYNFLNQNIGIAIGILTVPVSLILFNLAKESSLNKNKIFYYLVGIVIGTIGFGVYQSIILLYIVTVASCYLLKIIKEGKNCWKDLIWQIVLFGIMIIIYEIISKLTGPKGQYLSIKWAQDGIVICVRNIYYVIKDTIKCYGIFYNVGYPIAIIMVVILSIYIAKDKKIKLGVLLSTIAIVLSPFYIMLVTGVNQLYRTQFNYSYTTGFLMMITIVILSSSSKDIIKYFSYTAIIVSLVLAYRQSYTTANLFSTADIMFEYDTTIANKLMERIEEQDWYDIDVDYKLIFIGKYIDIPDNAIVKGEIIGNSFFDFGIDDSIGVSYRAIAFLNVIGYNFKMPTMEEYNNARTNEQYNSMPNWPKDKSIKLINNDTIVVKLSETIKGE